MDALVLLQVAGCRAPKLAQATLVWLFARVHAHVRHQEVRLHARKQEEEREKIGKTRRPKHNIPHNNYYPEDNYIAPLYLSSSLVHRKKNKA